MKKLALTAATLLILVSFTVPAEAGFRSFAADVEMMDGLDRVWIPFFGIGRALVRVTHPDGIHDIKLAVFEDRGGADPIDLERLIDRHLDPESWSPLVHARSQDEDTHVLVQERGGNMGVFIAARDGDEVVVLEIELDAERFVREMEGEGDFVELARGER